MYALAVEIGLFVFLEISQDASGKENLNPCTGRTCLSTFSTSSNGLPLNNAKTMLHSNESVCTLSKVDTPTNGSLHSLPITNNLLKLITVPVTINLSRCDAIFSHKTQPPVTTVNFSQPTATIVNFSRPCDKVSTQQPTTDATPLEKPGATTTAKITDLPQRITSSSLTNITTNVCFSTEMLAPTSVATVNLKLNNADKLSSPNKLDLSTATNINYAKSTSSFCKMTNAANCKLTYGKEVTNSTLQPLLSTVKNTTPVFNHLSQTETATPNVLVAAAASSQAVNVVNNFVSVKASAPTCSQPRLSSACSSKPPLKTVSKSFQDSAKKSVNMLSVTESSEDSSLCNSSELEISYTSSDSSEDDLPLGATAATLSPGLTTFKCDLLAGDIKNNTKETTSACPILPHSFTSDNNLLEKSLLLPKTEICDRHASNDIINPFVSNLRKELLTQTINFRKQRHLLEQQIFELKKRKITLEVDYLAKKFELEKKITIKEQKC